MSSVHRLRRRACAAVYILAALLLGACSSPHIYKKDRIEAPSIVTVDAKQRAIVFGTSRRMVGDVVVEVPRYCAEPSPDVFSVVAQALSAGGTLGRSADPKSMELALNAAFSSAEQGSTIPRTQTVNMLRELMYRTCERYMDGGITDLELPVQAARDQRLMVSILAIESLAGAVAPKPVVIGANANAGGGSDGAAAAVRLDDARKDMQSTAEAQRARQKDYDAITTDKKDCEAIADAVAKKAEDKLSDDQKGKRAKCESATSALASAKTAASDSATYYQSLLKVASGGGVPVSTGAGVMTSSAAGGLDAAHDAAVTSVAATIQDIVTQNMNQDEFLFLCMKILSPQTAGGAIDPKAKSDQMKERCIRYIDSGIQQAEEQKRASADALYKQRTDPLFGTFWNWIAPKGTVDASRFRQGVQTLGRAWPGCFAGDMSRDRAQQCFYSAKVTSQDQRNLAKLGGAR